MSRAGLFALLFLVACSARDDAGLPDVPEEAAPSATDEDHLDARVARIEAVIDDALPPKLRALARCVNNKQLPSKDQLALFRETLEVSGILEPGESSMLESVHVELRHWHLDPESRLLAREDLGLWDSFFQEVDYFKNASFKVVRGDFLGAEERVLETPVKFSALARTSTGYQYAKAELLVHWSVNDAAQAVPSPAGGQAAEQPGPDWRISSWKTLSFDTYGVAELLFTDVFGETVPEDLYRKVAERTRELELRAATIVANLDAKKNFDELSLALDDVLLPYTRAEVDAVLPNLSPKEKEYLRRRYGEQVHSLRKLGELLEVSAAELSELSKRVDRQLGEARRSQRPGAIARLRRDDAFRRQVTAGSAEPDSFNSAALSVTDIDNDGFDDIFLSRNERNFLLRNLGNGSFEDYSEQVDLPQSGRPINAALFIDTDNDGDLDLIYGYKDGLGYFINEGGRYVERTQDLFEGYQPRGNVAMSAADYNGDGLIDVYVQSRDIFQPASEMITRSKLGFDDGKLYGAWLPDAVARRFYARAMEARVHSTFDRPGPPNQLLRNMGGGRLALDPAANHLELFSSTHFAAWSDYDGDGDPDLYVANDFGPNNFFRNDAGSLVDITAETGTADVGFGMGVSWGDYDNDGDHDLYVTNMYSKAGLRITSQSGLTDTRASLAAHGNTLFRNDAGAFLRVSGEYKPALTVEPGGWGWGSQFIDVDNDGFLDIYAPSGYVSTPAGFEDIQDT